MEESIYQLAVEAVFHAVEDALEEVDPEVVECERSGDVLVLTFPGGARFVLNTQRATQQIWLAARAQAWHFSYDVQKAQWLSLKQGQEAELFATLAAALEAQGAGKIPVHALRLPDPTSC